MKNSTNKLSCSILISTYNWPKALSLCLKSLSLQSVPPDEIIICDDGSSNETKNVIDQFKKVCLIPLKHIWQPDEGFQLAKIRNKGFAAAAGDYLIQIDGDLILHPDFVKDHLLFSKKGYFTTGSRVLLSEESTKQLIEDSNINLDFSKIKYKNFFNQFRAPAMWGLFATTYKNKRNYKYYVKGCNMAFWKKDIFDVNGYNEDFIGWGREDSEIAIRLMNLGVKKRFLKFGGICYHLFHVEASRELEQQNIEKMNNAIKNRTILSPKGLNQY
jgi:glycosyltransferase involved in cell wall biosynthesis